LDSGPFIGIPDKAEGKQIVCICLLFAILFAIFFGGAEAITAWRSQRFEVHFAWETGIPFVPAAALIYTSIFWAMVATPFIIRTVREMRPLFCAMLVQLLAGFTCFLVFPVAQAFPERHADGVLGAVFTVADIVNLSYNLDKFHSRSGRPCFVMHYSPYYDLRERFFMSLSRFDELFDEDRRRGRTFVSDRAIYSLATLRNFGDDHFITWERRRTMAAAAGTKTPRWSRSPAHGNATTVTISR
jgi:hypothetical protein